MDKINLDKQVQEILNIAEQHDLDQNFFFLTTFERYRVQIEILKNLKQIFEEDGVLVKKEYVKGRQNIYSHPAITSYNHTADSANKTVSTLMRIIKTFKDPQNESEIDPLLEILSNVRK